MRDLGVMTSRGEDASYRRGNAVIVRSPRGLEVGRVLCEAGNDALNHLDDPPTGQIVRLVTGDDANEVNRIDDSRLKKIEIVEQQIEKLGLEMKLIDVEQLFGGERMIVFYLADDRVDFRELVRNLAGEFQTRIEMKQIGVRDEAKLLADYGDCGKPVCCNNHLVTMPPVSMKMAKLQKATLDPTKISGRCGRLKCCLRYEFDHYEESHKAMPRAGQHIVTREGRARVIAQRVLLEQLLIETEDHRRIVIDSSEVLSVIRRESGDKPSGTGSSSESKSTATRGSRPSTASSQSSDSSTPRSTSSSGTKPQRQPRSESSVQGETRNGNPPGKRSDERANRDSGGLQPGDPAGDKPGSHDPSASSKQSAGKRESGGRRRTRRGGKRNRKKKGGGPASS